MLGDLGYVVVEAGSSEEAVNKLRAGLRPDVLITDHLMAGMNGTGISRDLSARSTQESKSSSYRAALRSRAWLLDLARLTKPFREAELAECLGNLI